jgi:hypothetical protein
VASALTGAQIRMALAFLGWTIADLADRAAIGEATVKALEKTDGVPIAAGGIAQTLAGRDGHYAAKALSASARP